MAETQRLSTEELAKLRLQLKKEALELAEASANMEDAAVEVVMDVKDSSGSKEIEVEIAEDQMSATIYLKEPAEGEKYSVPEVVNLLRNRGVVLGIQTPAIMEAINNCLYDQAIVVAQGKEVTPGVDGSFEFMIDMEERKTPLIRPDGTVDYSSVGRVVSVQEGDLIAIYHPAIQGTKGYNVKGLELLPKFAKDQPPLRGRNIRKTEDEEYYATMAGRISRDGSSIEILDVYEVNDDLDWTSGNIEFYGDLIINGNVNSGVLIRAGRNITINGTVANAKIFAGGDITITRGIQGAGEGKISCRGSVYSDFIEYATVDAGCDVFANYILDSQVKANGQVHLDGSKGCIIGGYVHGLNGVELRTSGSVSEPKTIIHTGYSNEDHNKYTELAIKEKEIKGKVDAAVEEMSKLLQGARTHGIDAVKKKQIFELNKTKDEAYAELDSVANEKKAIGERMSRSSGSYIVVRGDVFANTIIAINAIELPIKIEEAATKYVCKSGVIERRSYSRI